MRTRVVTLAFLTLPAVAAAQGAPPIHMAPVVPPAFRLLADPEVQKDVGLTDAQRGAAERVQQLWPLAASGLPMGLLGYVPPEFVWPWVNRQTADFLATGLTKEQRTRLDQILFQLREREFGAHHAFAMAARDLGLRPDQVDDVHGLKAQRVEEIDRVVTSAQRFEKVKTEVQAANGDTFEKMAEMLTRAQRERLKELRGKPFTGFFGGSLSADKTPKTPEPRPAQYSATNVGYYDLELQYATTPAVVAELNLSADQVKALSAAWTEATGDFGVVSGRLPKGWVDAVHSQTEKALDKHLTKDQRARFDQLMMQRRAKVSREAVCTYPAAIATLKLTPIQLQQLSGGKRLPDVLSKEQLASFDKLLGAPFELPAIKDDYLPTPAPAPAAMQAPLLPYAQARDFLRLTDRLKLNDDQVRKLRDLAEDEPKVRELIQKELSLDDTPPVAGAGRTHTAVTAVTEHYRAVVEQQCWDVLDPPQQSIARKLFGVGRK